MNWSDKYESLQKVIAEKPGHIAFSGGVDSSLVLKAAVDVLGDNKVTAYFANSILQREVDLANVLQIADVIGAEIQIVEISPLAWPEFVSNPRDRCYLCKKKVYQLFLDLIPDRDEMSLLDGTNLDDKNTDRPGHKAIKELRVITPLVTAGLGKDDIREIARQLGLPNWNRESASCLATRVQHGTPITLPKLATISACEEVIGQLGIAGCRARLSADERSITIEVRESDLEMVAAGESRTKLLSNLNGLGIERIFLDLAGR